MQVWLGVRDVSVMSISNHEKGRDHPQRACSVIRAMSQATPWEHQQLRGKERKRSPQRKKRTTEDQKSQGGLSIM